VCIIYIILCESVREVGFGRGMKRGFEASWEGRVEAFIPGLIMLRV
jgi:hypothetical protein